MGERGFDGCEKAPPNLNFNYIPLIPIEGTHVFFDVTTMFFSIFVLITANVLLLHVSGGNEYPELTYIPNIASKDSNETEWNDVSLVYVLDFFNMRNLVVNWELVRTNLTEFCDKDLQKYVKGLVDHEQWALKSKCFSGFLFNF